eukprot:3839723-Karenia_brevis.AAC.1
MPTLKRALAVKCYANLLPTSTTHKHIPLLGGRAKQTGVYPPRLVNTILKSVAEQLRRDREVPVNALGHGPGPHVDNDPLDLDYSLLAPLGHDGAD